MKYIYILLFISSFSVIKSQSVKELYDARKHKELVALAENTPNLTGIEMYMAGYAYFQLEQDDKAIAMYDKAIAAGYAVADVHYFKALSLRYAGKFADAITAFDIAIDLDKANQMYVTEKGMAYYYQKKYKEALPVFKAACKLPNNHQTAFYMVGHTYNMLMQFDSALHYLHIARKNISNNHEKYIETLKDIGRLEYTVTKNYAKSANAYSELLSLYPQEYEMYSKLIKSYNAAGNYTQADSIFELLRGYYNDKVLPEDFYEFSLISVDEWEWDGRRINVFKNLKEAKEPIDVTHKVYSVTKGGDKVERTFTVEKTIKFEKDGAEYLYCEEKKGGGHATFNYGWNTYEQITIPSLKRIAFKILEDNSKPAAETEPKK